MADDAMNHEEIKSLLGAYALGAVDETEAQVVEEHLHTCHECTAEFTAMKGAVSALAEAAAPAGLSEGFADRAIHSISRPATVPAATEDEAEVVDIRRAPRRRTGLRVALASGVAAMLAAILVLSLTTINANNKVTQQNAAIQSLVTGQNGFHLTSARGATAAAVTDGGKARFVVVGLGPAPQGKTYQVWIRRGEKAYSAGTFDASDNVVVTPMSGSLSGADGVAVTIEPAGGSKQPTSTPILSS